MKLSNTHIERFQINGFFNGGALLNDEEVEILKAETMRVIADQEKSSAPQPTHVANLGGEDAPVWQIINICKASEAFEKLLHHPDLAAMAGGLLKAREIRLFHDQIQFKPPATGGVNYWHQDSPFWPIIQPKTTQVTAWIALDDADIDNGCMSMVPGSHRWGVQADYLKQLQTEGVAFEDLPDFDPEGNFVHRVYVPVRKGHVHFHHPLCWHGSHDNKSGRPRRAIAIHLMTEQTIFQGVSPDVCHPCQHLVEVEPGKKLEGEHFPLLWSA